MKTKFFLKDRNINDPNNAAALSIELNYDKDAATQAVTINDWEFGVGDPSDDDDGARIILNTLYDKTGIGIVQGIPFRIELDNERGKSYTIFNGYINAWQAQYGGREQFNGVVTAPATMSASIDWLNDVADSFSFEYLYSIGAFGRDKFVPIPYVLDKKQNAFEVVMTLVTVFVMIDKIKEQTTAVSQYVTGSANPLEMSTIPRFILQIIYLITLFASLIPLIIRLINMIIPPVKYHQAMYVKDLFKIACDHLGIGFKSSILEQYPYSKMVLLPEKYNISDNTGIFEGLQGSFKSNEKVGYYRGTFGDLIRAMKIPFNGKIVMANNTLHFENADFRLGNGGIRIPYSMENEHVFSLNWQDFFSNMVLKWMTDLNDRHTIQEYQGTSVQYVITPITQIDQKMSLLRNLDEQLIPFALGKRKESLSTIEKIIKDFFAVIDVLLSGIIAAINIAIDAINLVIKIINKILKALNTIGIRIKAQISTIQKIKKPALSATIQNRVGMLKMESDYVAVPKLIIIDQNSNPALTKVSDDNFTYLRAKYLFRKYHYMKSFVSIDGQRTGQYILRKSDAFPFDFEMYEESLNNNSIFTDDGKTGLAISLQLNPESETATCEYKLQIDYMGNLKIEENEPSE